MTTEIRRLPLRGCLVRDLSNPEKKINIFQLKLVAFKVTGKRLTGKYRLLVRIEQTKEMAVLRMNKIYKNIPLLQRI